MYIDNLYTKLYSERNWNGLSQLVTEIKSFARKDYEGLNQQAKDYLNQSRSELAKQLMRARFISQNRGKSIPQKYKEHSMEDLNYIKPDQALGAETFLHNYDSNEVRNKLRNDAEKVHNYYTIRPDYLNEAGNVENWSKARADNDTRALQNAIAKNQDRLIGDKQVGKPDMTELAGINDRKVEYGVGANDRYFVPNSIHYGSLETPEDRYKENERVKGNLFKGRFDPFYNNRF